jgi:TRAP transporter TAXI family solute receptor
MMPAAIDRLGATVIDKSRRDPLPKRVASMFFAALLMALGVVNPAGSQARAAADCAAAPKSPPPKGKHWYYRTDRASRRKCWFLGPQDDKIVPAASEASVSARSVAGATRTAGHRPITPTQAAPLIRTPSTLPPSLQTRPAAIVEAAHVDLRGPDQAAAARGASRNVPLQQEQWPSSQSINPESISINHPTTVSIILGNPDGTYLSIAHDMSAVLDDRDGLRILPIVARGGSGNLRDVRYLKGIDIAITQSNQLNLLRRANASGPIDDFACIARLFNEEMHVVVRAESRITSIKQLHGKKVNFGDVDSGTQVLTRDIFERLGIKATEVNMGQDDAFEALKQGMIAATVLIDGKPTGSTLALKSTDGFRILPVPFSKPLQSDYLPTTLTHDDYPNLIAPGSNVDTIAVGTVMIAYNWAPDTDRYRRIAKFIETLFPRIAEFQMPPHHPKWREVNLSATVPGWKRFPAAEEWLERYRKTQLTLRQEFEEFLTRKQEPTSVAASDQEREQLFEEFLKWNRAQLIGANRLGARQ